MASPAHWRGPIGDNTPDLSPASRRRSTIIDDNDKLAAGSFFSPLLKRAPLWP